jgi:hypothetical protein
MNTEYVSSGIAEQALAKSHLFMAQHIQPVKIPPLSIQNVMEELLKRLLYTMKYNTAFCM